MDATTARRKSVRAVARPVAAVALTAWSTAGGHGDRQLLSPAGIRPQGWLVHQSNIAMSIQLKIGSARYI
jgi:hypothetical protein